MADLRAVGLLLHDGAMTMISGLVHLPFDENFHDDNDEVDDGWLALMIIVITMMMASS